MEDFRRLIERISVTHYELQKKSVNAINQALTVRNWLIGFYIVEYQQSGEDRAIYGGRLLVQLASQIKIKGLTPSELSRCRQFYSCYPYFAEALTHASAQFLPSSILGALTQEFVNRENSDSLRVAAKTLLARLSYTHFTHLVKITDNLKRAFYEIECIKSSWSVRELKRQIASLYYERSGLSVDPEKLHHMTQVNASPRKASDVIKNIYAFEFLDIYANEAVEESDLESALLSNLQSFISELGHGFCFEARQKRLLIGDNYYFVDLVFYHRILKSHILLELKIGEFQHGDIGQLNTYINYFKEEISEPSDNLPVGILLVAEKDSALVKYATAGMDKNLFVKQYLVNLPDKAKPEEYVNKQLNYL